MSTIDFTFHCLDTHSDGDFLLIRPSKSSWDAKVAPIQEFVKSKLEEEGIRTFEPTSFTRAHITVLNHLDGLTKEEKCNLMSYISKRLKDITSFNLALKIKAGPEKKCTISRTKKWVLLKFDDPKLSKLHKRIQSGVQDAITAGAVPSEKIPTRELTKEIRAHITLGVLNADDDHPDVATLNLDVNKKAFGQSFYRKYSEYSFQIPVKGLHLHGVDDLSKPPVDRTYHRIASYILPAPRR
jgi:hypothetical protein